MRFNPRPQVQVIGSLVAVVAIPVATAHFSASSKLDLETRRDELSRMFERSVRYTMLFIVPVAILIGVLRVRKVLHEVVAYDGSRITVTREVIDHIERKHPQMLSVAGLGADRLLSLMIQTIENPTEVYVDAHHTQYFLRKIDQLYFNVIIADGTVKTAYLMGERTHRRMGKTRWLHRLYST